MTVVLVQASFTKVLATVVALGLVAEATQALVAAVVLVVVLVVAAADAVSLAVAVLVADVADVVATKLPLNINPID